MAYANRRLSGLMTNESRRRFCGRCPNEVSRISSTMECCLVEEVDNRRAMPVDYPPSSVEDKPSQFRPFGMPYGIIDSDTLLDITPLDDAHAKYRGITCFGARSSSRGQSR